MALQEANVKATRKYENLLQASGDGSRSVEHIFFVPKSSLSSQISNFKLSALINERASYILVDEYGMELAHFMVFAEKQDLQLKLTRISKLIDEVKEVQEDIKKITEQSSI